MLKEKSQKNLKTKTPKEKELFVLTMEIRII